MRFEFATSARIIFGQGSIREVPALASSLGKTVLLLTGSNPERASALITGLQESGIAVILFQVSEEPTTEIVIEGAGIAGRNRCDLVIGMGGGSVIDAGKAIAALITNRGDLFDYLEIIGKAQLVTNLPAPYIAIPTTAGTGTEVTKNAVIISREHKVKVSMRSEMMLPKVVVVDPELTCSLPPDVTAHTGLDALTQLIEAFVSKKANPLTDSLCREGLRRAAGSLRRAYDEGNNVNARYDMCVASLFSGLALANAGLGAVHGFAAPIGGSFRAPHGLVCARLLPPAMESNMLALKERFPSSPALERYNDIARILTNNNYASSFDAIEWVKDLCSYFRIPTLSSIGMSSDDIPEVVQRAAKASSMKGNPVELTEAELSTILKKALL